MRVAVLGLWHLGNVTAACLASAGHQVTAIDENPETISQLAAGRLPVEEPRLGDLIRTQVENGRLRFSSDLHDVASHDVIWIAFDTPVNDDDTADTDFVFRRALAVLPLMSNDSLMLVSSQVPVGSVARLERAYGELNLSNRVRFACSPENLQLGKAIDRFMNPDRVVVGVRLEEDRRRLTALWSPFTNNIVWMSVESAEMTKHAVNAFLATSVSFINEIAGICEQVGANALEVERGLKTDGRIGERAYLHAGTAFAGGTLARDIMFLREIAARTGRDSSLFDGVRRSNDAHREWVKRRFRECAGSPRGKTIAVLGLTYKPGTSTLRRSSAVEACRWLSSEGASVRAYDPAVRDPEPEVAGWLEDSAEHTLRGADVLLVATEWPEFRRLPADLIVSQMKSPIVLDPSGHLEESLGRDERIRYFAVGRSR